MTAEFLQYQRLEQIHKAAAKQLRYCGFQAKARSDWKSGNFRIEVKCSADEVEELRRVGRFSNEIKIVAN